MCCCICGTVGRTIFPARRASSAARRWAGFSTARPSSPLPPPECSWPRAWRSGRPCAWGRRFSSWKMSNRPVAVITGTTHGIGTVTSRQLARAGYTVVMLCRNVTAATALAQVLRQQAPDGQLEVVSCDLADLTSVRTAAAAVLERYPRIDRLINNAGIVSTRRLFSVDGHELTFA